MTIQTMFCVDMATVSSVHILKRHDDRCKATSGGLGAIWVSDRQRHAKYVVP